MNTSNYHHIPQNLLLFVLLVGIFVLPAFAFVSFKPAVETSGNVLGNQTFVVKGINIEQNNQMYKFSGMVSSKSVVSLPLETQVSDKEVYLIENTEDVLVTLDKNIVEIYNTSNTDKQVKFILN